MNDYCDPLVAGHDPACPTPLYDTEGVLQAWRDPYSNQICSLNRRYQDCHVEPSGLVINAYGHPIARIGAGNVLLPLSSTDRPPAQHLEAGKSC